MSRAERDAAALVAAASPRGLGSLWTSGQAAFLRHRSTVFGYSQVLAGTGGRLAVQAIYFFVLANTLSLRDMGVFASVSAAGVLIGSFVGFGFQSFAFRAAAGRTALLGRYLALFYGCAAVSVPLGLAVALGCYHALFAGSIPLLPYLAVIVAEVVAWRFIELLTQVNNGLGRYGAAAAVLTASTGCRAGAALAFMLAGGGDAGVWACFYLGGNVVSAITLGLLYHPRVRLRWSWTLLRGRMWGALLYSYSYFAFMAQNEIDKIVILSIAGEHTTGLYAIAMRLIDLTAAPLRPIFVLYSRKLIQTVRVTRTTIRDILRIEGLVALASTAAFVVLVAALRFRPELLGRNVAAAGGFLAVTVLVPGVKNLMEFHSELFFARNRMGLRSMVATVLIVFKAAALAVLLSLWQGGDGWGLWLNPIYAALYAMSAFAAYGLLIREARR